MKAFLSFVFGVLVGVAGHWFFTQPRSGTARASATENARDATADAGRSLKETFNPDNIKDELARTGRVIREKSRQAGAALADATANARTTGAIKAKLIEDTGLSAFKIDVDTTDGVVTLSGTVSTPEEIAKAMELAWDTEGVHKVVSTLQVKAK